MFVTKEMNLAEQPVLQNQFADMQMALGAPADFALIHHNHKGCPSQHNRCIGRRPFLRRRAFVWRMV